MIEMLFVKLMLTLGIFIIPTLLIEVNYLWQEPPPLMKKVIKFLIFVLIFLGIAMLVTALCGVWTMK